MKVVHKDFNKGTVKVRVTDNEDLWILNKIVTEGDLVSGSTSRVIKKPDREGFRKRVFLKIKVEKVKFRQSKFVLKILGKIVEGPDEVPRGSYHSFNVDKGSKIIIKKDEWDSYVKKKLFKSVSKAPKVLITVIDSKEATHALMNNKVKELFSHHSRLPRKDQSDYDKRINDYYLKVMDQVKTAAANHGANKIIIAGPGFASKELLKIIKNRDKELASKVTRAHINHTGMTGVKELINSGAISDIISENEISEESRLVEEVLVRVKRGKLISYGLQSVTKAVTMGAADTLLISEGLIIDFRERKRFKELEELINKAESTGATVEFIGTRHEAGKQFYKFGGVAALLRYEV
ncbi:mRNA surveillance protein pelota [archaeon]|nr:mRNA surveillance protein pelota [archaeon]